jgi:hypothetical protein
LSLLLHIYFPITRTPYSNDFMKVPGPYKRIMFCLSPSTIATLRHETRITWVAYVCLHACMQV